MEKQVDVVVRINGGDPTRIKGGGQDIFNKIRKHYQELTKKRFVHIVLEGFMVEDEFIRANRESLYKI